MANIPPQLHGEAGSNDDKTLRDTLNAFNREMTELRKQNEGLERRIQTLESQRSTS